MEAQGGCCIAKYKNVEQASSNINKIMLKFRPIAPKPSTNGAIPRVEGGAATSDKIVPSSTRSRRKSNGKKCCVRKKKTTTTFKIVNNGEDDKKIVTTLSLLPEAPDLNPKMSGEKSIGLLKFDDLDGTDFVDLSQQGVVESFIIVEAITDTWTDDMVVRNMMRMLEEDTCPGFLSDALNRVWWTNVAYRRLVMGDTWQDHRLVVSVVMRERVAETRLRSFTCRVRVQRSYDGKQCRGSCLTLPCDVWRIDDGGFAWRLDVDAALSLGR